MKYFVTVILGVALCFWSLPPAFATIDQEDLPRLAKTLQTGKGFAEARTLSSEERQMLFIKIGRGLNCSIGFKTST